MNPPSGTLIDDEIVEETKSDESVSYDFYMIPQETTQGCVTPTHFFVAYDDSGMSQQHLQQLTFDLCHYYANWAGPIKVPSPCMYAHT